jgi:hypothetical protein
MVTCLARPAIDDGGERMVPSPDEDVGVGRILEHAEDPWIDRFDPNHLAVAGLA